MNLVENNEYTLKVDFVGLDAGDKVIYESEIKFDTSAFEEEVSKEQIWHVFKYYEDGMTMRFELYEGDLETYIEQPYTYINKINSSYNV